MASARTMKFAALAVARHYRKAAKRMGISQSSRRRSSHRAMIGRISGMIRAVAQDRFGGLVVVG